MLLRVRGSGGCAENSEAIVMNLRAYCQQFATKREASLASQSTPLTVALDCSHCTLSAVWKEVWNLVDIVYDDLSRDRDRHINSNDGDGDGGGEEDVVVAVPRLSWSGDGKRDSRNACSIEAAALLRSSFTPGLGDSEGLPVALCFAVAGEPSHWLGALWQLSFICTLMSAAGETFRGWERRVRQIVFVTSKEENPRPLLPLLRCVVRHWFRHVHTEGEAVSGAARDMDLPLSIVSTASLHPLGRTLLPSEAAAMQWFRTDTNTSSEQIAEAAQRLADEIQIPASLHVVPVSRFSSGDDRNSLLEQAALAKENMVLNFCPCCGHTDEGSGCGHH